MTKGIIYLLDFQGAETVDVCGFVRKLRALPCSRKID